MYYSYKCTYCGRLFYTFDRNKEHAANRLYHTVKQHLIDYNEDHKEYEMDDGEHADTEQIYREMTESPTPPPGGYEAKGNKYKATVKEAGNYTSTANTTSVMTSSLGIIVLLFLLLGGILALYFFVPEVKEFVDTFVIPQ